MAPQAHQQAQFVAISPEFDLNALVQSTDNFKYVTRLSTEKLKEHSIRSFEALVLAVVIHSGKPLVIEGWGANLPPWLFSSKWLEENCGTKPESVRDIPNEVNIPMTVGHYLRSMEQLSKQSTPASYQDPRCQRLYLKDIDCPEAWASHLKETIPECVYYLNDCIESVTGGYSAMLPQKDCGQTRYEKVVASAGDLMSSLPPEMRALNMMCYIGHEGTFTPAHREMCATLGHNLMVETSQDGRGEKEGSALWFMTETKERELVSEYFLSMLGHDIEVEKHFAQVNAWKRAPFNVYVVEQRVGDLILIPPLAPHQVWNRGTRTMKVAWNRTTVETLELALHEALPRARMVCRDEQYKCKAIIYYALLKYYDLIRQDTIEENMWKYGRIKQLLEDFKKLFYLYQDVIVSEMFSPTLPNETDVEFLPFDSNVTCSYCRCNIFNRFLTCRACVLHDPSGVEDTYDVCMDCYAMGRSCACISNLSWVEQWDWNTLESNYELWRGIIVRFDGYFEFTRSPQPLQLARKKYGKKPIAEVCQEQLKIRPWTDITEPQNSTPPISEIETEVNDGRAKFRKGKKKHKLNKTAKRKNEPIKDKKRCHTCCHYEWNWKLAFCTTCSLAYCYGVLWRAFDLMPQTVMEDREWQCPKCLKICSCSGCRKIPSQKPYQPKGTLLGHDTRKVADHRSVESLVNFARANLTWLRDENAGNCQESTRMKKLKEKAEAEKARVSIIDESYLPDDIDGDGFGDMSVGLEGKDFIDMLLVAQTNDDNEYSGLHGLRQSAVPNDHDYSTSSGLVRQGPSHTWMEVSDDPYEQEDFVYGQHSPSYLSHLSAPVASTVGPEQRYPDPTHISQTCIMGIAHYQLGHGIDQIVYDPPNINEPPQPVTGLDYPNRALSDLLAPNWAQVELAKKRRRNRFGSGDENDIEFSTSKKQKKGLEPQDFLNAMPLTARSGKQLPHGSNAKPQTYADMDEDQVLLEDKGAFIPRHSSRKRQHDSVTSDLGKLAAHAIPKTKPTVYETNKTTKVPAFVGRKSNTIQTPTRSAWLARKKAKNVEDNFSSESSRRMGQSHTHESTESAYFDISSDSEENEQRGMASDHQNCDLDSLTGEYLNLMVKKSQGFEESIKTAKDRYHMNCDPIMISQDKAVQSRSLRGNTLKLRSNKSKAIPAPNKRGRRRKLASENHCANSPTWPQPSPPTKQATPKRISLREKLALKGKTVKIVAKKSRNSAGPSTVMPHPLGPYQAKTTATDHSVTMANGNNEAKYTRLNSINSAAARPIKAASDSSISTKTHPAVRSKP